jgi:hypothetical protein
MLEMSVPTKYADEIDHLVNGFGGLHGLHHRLAWAIMPQCIRDLTIAGLMVANHPDEVMNALFAKALNELADKEDANETEETRK